MVKGVGAVSVRFKEEDTRKKHSVEQSEYCFVAYYVVFTVGINQYL